MNELIRVSVNEKQEQMVSARELHQFLEIGTEYRHWFPRMTEYGFSEGIDFTPVIFDHPKNHQPINDHQMTIEMAKELCMIQRNEKGRQARQYFLQLEKAWNDPELVMARSLQFAHRKLLSYEEKVMQLEARVEKDKPKVLFADAVSTSKTTILIGELAKIIKQNGIDMGEKRLFVWLRANGYLISRAGTDYNSPTQRSMNQGLFKVKETAITHGDGHVTVSKTTKVTGKGQQYFISKFLNERINPCITINS